VFSTLFTDRLEWILEGQHAAVNPSLPVCRNGCVETSTTEIKGNLDQTAIELAQFAKTAADLLARSAKKSLGKSAAAQVRTDSIRAKKKADEFVKKANEVLLKFPAVSRMCPNAAQLCATVDRQADILTLRGLYKQARAAVKRITARRYFNTTFKTTRTDQLVANAKAVEARGQLELDKLPRFASECR
jgi:hypothetical protein